MTWAELCQLHDLRVEVEKIGVRLRGKGWGLCPLPFHQHRNGTPSFSIFEYRGRQRWKCWGSCGLSGDVIDLYGYLHIPGYNPHEIELRRQAADLLRGGPLNPAPYRGVEKTRLLSSFAWQWFQPPGDLVLEYLHRRGLDEATIRHFRFGSAARIDKETGRPVKDGIEGLLAIPCLQENTTVGVKLRLIRPAGKLRYFSLPYSRSGLFNFDEVYLTDRPVLIAKGELCAAVMRRAGFLACALTSGEAGTQKGQPLFQEIRSALSLAPRIVVGDNDPPGRKYAPQRADTFDAGLRYPPEACKDWDEWFLARPDECVRETERWIEAACHSDAASF